jgi:hypothetical protein
MMTASGGSEYVEIHMIELLSYYLRLQMLL